VLREFKLYQAPGLIGCAGGIIALAIAMTYREIPEMLEFFAEAAQSTFKQSSAPLSGLLSKIDPKHVTTKALMLVRALDSVFDSEQLKVALVKFFGQYTSLFSPALIQNHQQCTTRVAVTAAKDSGYTGCLIASYNRPELNDDADFEREEDQEKDLKVWEAALATSAAPFWLPPFIKEETSTNYVDGAVFANCPAQVAYGETLKLWPNSGASLDFLLSVSTGAQDRRMEKIPAAVKFGGFVAIRAMFERQLDTQKSWDQFKTSIAPANIKSRLHRLDPPITADYVALHHYQMMPELKTMVEGWVTDAKGADQIRDIANLLTANLFFFEPLESTGSSNPGLSDRTCEVLEGTIQCRLSHESMSLRRLLEDHAESFWYAEVADSNIDYLNALPEANWQQVTTVSGAFATELVNENDVRKFRLRHTFSAKPSSNFFQVLAVRLKGSSKRIPISGFPSTLSDLQMRANQKWLQ
jgi:predicted acylesterase/phospholipase RssA